MKEEEKIHLLVKELIIIEEDLDEEVKEIIHDHINTCDECRRLYSDVKATEIPSIDNNSNETHIKPLKSLRKLNIGLLVFLIIVRIGILFFIFYANSSGYNFVMLEGILQASINLFYLPSVIFLLLFTFIFFKTKIFVVSLIFDLIIIIFGSHLLTYII